MNICSLILYISFSYLYHNDQKLADNVNEIWFGDIELNKIFTPQYRSDKELFAILDNVKTDVIKIAEDTIESQDTYIEDDIIAQESDLDIVTDNLEIDKEISIEDEQALFIEDAIEEDIALNDYNSDIAINNPEIDKQLSFSEEEELVADLDDKELIIKDLTIKDEGAEIEIKTKEVTDLDNNLSIKNEADKIIVEEAVPDIVLDLDDNKQLENIAVDQDNEVSDVQVIKEYNQIYKEIAGPSLAEIKEVFAARRLQILFDKIKPYKRADRNYQTLYKAKIINQKSYNIKNQHLDRVFFYEQYFPNLYNAIKQSDIEAIISLTEIIGVNNNVMVKGEKPFIYAIKLGDINVIRKMLHLGYDPNERDNNGNAPIHLAILSNRVDIVTELIKFKANITLPNKKYLRPIKLALNNKNYFIVDILTRAGARNIDTHKTFSNYLKANKAKAK